MNLVEQVRLAGVVGAGGGGFPAHIKLAGKADVVIANGAECEPLLHKDAAVMERNARDLVTGLQLAMEAVGATTGIVGLKAKNQHAQEAVTEACRGTTIRIHLLGDYYPAGDEYDLVYTTTGRLIPPAGIPLNVGAVVSNVETLVNIAAAAEGRPVTHKTLTIAGAVAAPATLTVPLGTTLRACLDAAGGPTVLDPVLCIGGMMMGETTTDLDRPVTKTTGGVIVLPRSHRIIQRKLKPATLQHAIGKSACDQCRYCTEYCPRFLLGYAVEPHQVMRSLAFTATGAAHWNDWAALCCACGLCTLYACPEELFPKEACDQAKVEMRRANVKWSGPATVKPHPMREGRRVPIKTLMRKLHISDYEHPAPWRATQISPSRLVIALKQSAGSPCQPCVRAGDAVAAGQMLGNVPEKALGAAIHAPLTGTVTEITPNHILLQVSPKP
ncbi:4Fe-4S dicluster domain-containing protein [Opitutus terrae]|uniref:Respiratory-chain NADH dehydrogenase domain 51 kDa subunit n=1 Tax=Opitutus terrae (strain DSM 11246 / JCM 15787 / PB90-1) TaxID=452637 RepID=B1ZMR0_OPITP|nr:4Fe-4S dicluster domain-containing protein [Opitutus terrae]ACB75338.1 Respiratory-chain NADH dehydrogenase domain 51 kDa subunit [Opitutus terrae PB90-1]